MVSPAIRRGSLAGLFLAAAARPAAAQVIRSGFATDAQGRTGSSGGVLAYVSAGGNPGGFIQMTDLGTTDLFVIAPSAYLGDRTAFLGGALSFDAKQIVGTADYAPFGIVTIRSGANFVFADIAPPPPDNPSSTVWKTYAVTLDATSFGTTPASFAAILGDVTSIEVTVESQVGVIETTGFDNFQIATPVPEPGGIAALGGMAVAGLVGCLRRWPSPPA